MRALLFDMCVDRRHAAPVFAALAPANFITDWIADDAGDREVLTLARRLNRTLLTEDADFGDLIFRDRLAAPPAVLLVMTQLIPLVERRARLLTLAPVALDGAEGCFAVVGPSRCRFRPLPQRTAADSP